MRVAVAVAVLSFTACTCIDSTRPARYLCTPDAGTAEQCPGGWRCAIEGYCVDPSKGAPLACREGLADCTGGWTCGFEGTCIDPAVASPLRCGTDAHCGAGWNCGPSGICFDRRDAGAVPCRLGITTDCDDGWRCGLENVCHPLDAGAPYLCKEDRDCEARWRCGPDGECVDAISDALRPNADAGLPFGGSIHPTLPRRLADLVSARQKAGITSCDGVRSATTVSLLHGRTLTKWVEFAGGFPIDCTPITDGGKYPELAGEQRELVLPDRPVELVDQGPYTLGVLADGGLFKVSYVAQQALAFATLAAPFPVRHVRAHNADAVAVFGDQAIAIYDGTSFEVAPLTLPDAGPITVHDAVFFQDQARTSILYAGTEQGLLMSVRDMAGFRPWAVIYADCIKPFAVLRVVPFDGADFSAAVMRQTIATRSQVELVRLESEMLPSPILCETERLADGLFVDPVGTACRVSATTLQLFPVLEAAQETFDAYVQEPTPDGGTIISTCFVTPRFGFRGPLAANTRISTTSASTFASTDEHGALWLSGFKGGLGFEPATLSSLPRTAGGPVDRATVSVPTAEAAEVMSIPIYAARYRRLPALGFVRDDQGIDPLGRVLGEPSWILSETVLPLGTVLVVMHSETRGTIAHLPPALQRTPARAAVATVPGGRTTLVVSTGDLLSHADVTAVPPGGVDTTELHRAAQLKFATSPLPSGTITSLVAVPGGAQPQSSYLLAYLIASGRVFRVRADNPVVFRSDEVIIEPNEAIAVWADASRARVGFASGTVYGLPSRARLAGPVPGSSPVRQYESVCGHTFALTDDALYRLVAGDLPVGEWQRVPLDSDDAGVPLTGGLIYGDGRGLQVHRARGYVDELRGHACLP